MKKTQWGKKNITLVIVVVILAIAVFLDESPDGVDNEGVITSNNNKQSDTLGDFISKDVYQAKFKKNQQILASKEVIRKAYATIAIPYALAMAELQTFKYDVEINRDDAEKLIQKLLPDDGSVIIEQLTINNEVIENNSYQYMAMIKLKIYTHQSALKVLEALGQYKNGTIWDSYSLLAHHKKHFFTLSGHLRILFIKAVE